MKGLWLLAWQHLRFNWFQNLILTLALSVSIFLPLAGELLTTRYQEDLLVRARATPLIAGAKGNRFDLTLLALYFRQGRLDPIPMEEVSRIQQSGLGLPIPLNVRFTARGKPIVATSTEYFERRGLRAAQGTLPLLLGDATLGARVARTLKMGPHDNLFSDQRELYDISKPPALKLHVVGVLAESGSPDDEAIFVDIKTAWVLEGLAHSHRDPKQVERSLVMKKSSQNVVLSPALVEYNEVTPENLLSFHYHVTSAELPCSAILVYPRDQKALTILKARVNASKLYQMLRPKDVIAELLARVFRVKRLFDLLAAVLFGSTIMMTLLVTLLSMRMRQREVMTLNRIGCSRLTVVRLHTMEILLVMMMSLILAASGLLWMLALGPDLLRLLPT